MAFHLKNLKTQRDKFFSTLTAQQLCDIVQDGEIMNYVNRMPHRREEVATLFEKIGQSCDPRQKLQSTVRQKQLAPLVMKLSQIIKEYEVKKVKLAANLANLQQKQKEAANAAAAAQAEANRKAAENLQRAANARIAAEAEAAAREAANANLKTAETALNLAAATIQPIAPSPLTQELMNLQKNLKNVSARLNKAIRNSNSQTRSAAAARRRRNSTRKTRRT